MSHKIRKHERHFLGALTLALSAAAPLAGYAANAARVDFATGDVKALVPDGRTRALAKGGEVASGETVDTGSGRIQLRFSDGARVSLAPQTLFRIDDYRFEDKTDGSERGFFSLLKGGLRTITGLVGRTHRDNYRITTAVATIGIRGTEFSVTYGNSIHVTTGEGSNEVCNAGGCLVVDSGETAYVADANTRPVLTDRKAELPPPPAQTRSIVIVGNDTDRDGKPAALVGLSESLPAIVPLASGIGSFGVAYVDASGPFGAGLLGGTLTFASSGELTGFSDSTYPLMGFSGGTVAEHGADGIIAWGRWTGGTRTDSAGNPTPLAGLNYVGALNSTAPTIAQITGRYTVFASTAPVITSGGSVVATGAPNSVSGSLTVNFTNPLPSEASLGALSYSLNIPVAGQTFSVNGSATQYVNTGFLGTSSTITSTGSACQSSCTGIIPWGDAIQGFFTGAAAERAGANYGFSSALGKVTGAAVFKPDPSVTPVPPSQPHVQ